MHSRATGNHGLLTEAKQKKKQPNFPSTTFYFSTTVSRADTTYRYIVLGILLYSEAIELPEKELIFPVMQLEAI